MVSLLFSPPSVFKIEPFSLARQSHKNTLILYLNYQFSESEAIE